MRFSGIIMSYFVIGAVMWGGGVIAWGDAGIGSLLVEDPQTGQINEETSTELEELGGPIKNLLNSVSGGGLVAVWSVISGILGFLFWPIDVLLSVNAPMEAVVLLGGGPTIAFYATLIRAVRGSA
jgi:hypothetical protein